MPNIFRRNGFGYSLYLSLLLTFLLPSCVGENETSGQIEYISVQLEKDGDWSLMSKDGKIKFENEFKEAPSAVINGVFNVKEGKGYSVYRATGEKPEIINGLENLSYVGELNDGLMPVCFPEKRITIVDKDGKEKFELKPIKGKEIVECTKSFQEGMLLTKDENSKFGYYNTSGECIIAHKYDDAYSFSEGMALVFKDSLWSIIGKDGNKIFSFKKGLWPAFYPYKYENFYHYKDGKMFMRDSDGRYYLYDQKGESTKLSNKIKEILGFNEKYILYKSESGDYGTMDFNGEVVIRPKFQQLYFGDSGQLFGSRDGKDWEILDYSGKKIKALDCESAYYENGFGYLAKDHSGWYLLNNKGELVSKDAEFYQLANNFPEAGLVLSCYIPSEKIVSAVTDMITPDGVESYTFGQSMVELAQKEGLDRQKLIDDQISLLKLGENKIGTATINFGAFSKWLIAYEAVNYDYYSGYYRNPVWNHNSKIDVFRLWIQTASTWGKNGVNKLSDGFKRKGFEVSQYDSNQEYAATLLKKDGLNIFLWYANDSGGGISMAYYKNSMESVVKDFIKEVFNNIKSNNGISASSDDNTAVVEEVEDSVVAVEEVIVDSVE
ncbi:MAG: WG repeat-containing protein [Muribaculaceae bacterium]|nr:WG repeat-containing protein [Muribaculaceae bacterium]